jgi:class 3 adenylate cyclase
MPNAEEPETTQSSRGWISVLLVVALLAGLPLAVWFDLRSVSEAALTRQVTDLNAVLGGVRDFYSTDVVGRVLSGHTTTLVTNDFENHPGAIPIPATFSLELGNVVSQYQNNIGYRFVSDYPFRHRAPHQLDDFERSSLAALRVTRDPNQKIYTTEWNGLTTRVRIVAPIMMGQTCVACHNTHPDSPKRDWKIGDVRGIQELSIIQPVATNLFSFKYLLLYFAFAGVLGFTFVANERRQSAVIAGINARLGKTNDFLDGISKKLARYLSPQIFASIFSGERDVTIQTERKKLTIFFSDIKDFTATTERLQPEELAGLLNEYLTEMSAIALKWGGTIDKFIGDAMVVFFGDPETKGTAEDAQAAVRMAVEMQSRLVELNVTWRSHGIEHPFQARMGINTGFVNVGNFGSIDRMDYTIIGGEANHAARLETSAEPGGIVISYETYAVVRDIVAAHEQPPIRVKGINRDVVPYVVDGLLDASGRTVRVVNVHTPGLDLYLDPSKIDRAEADRIRQILRDALDRL